MEWPKFDFPKCSHIQSSRLSNVGRSSWGLKRSRFKICRSLTVDFENIKCKKKENSTKGYTVQNESFITLHQQMLPNSNPPSCSRRDLSQINAKGIPPLSPILVNGFLKNPTAYSPTPLRDSNSNIGTMLISSKRIDLVNPVVTSNSHCETPIILESSEPAFTLPCAKQLLLSDGSLTSSLQKLEVIPRNPTFTSQSKSRTSFVAVMKESDSLNWKCKKSGKEANYSPKLHTFPSITSSTNLYCSDSQLSLESDKSLTLRHTRSDDDVFQNHTVSVDDSGSGVSTSEQSRDCFFDVTIHEIEPNDSDHETKLIAEDTSPITNQLKLYDFQGGNSEAIHQKQYQRLSKLAETLKKRLFIASSDLVMWKCEEPNQHPVRRVTVISDSKPMKKSADMLCRNRIQEDTSADDNQEDRRYHDSLQRTSRKTFSIYQPLSKLNTSLGEFILSPHSTQRKIAMVKSSYFGLGIIDCAYSVVVRTSNKENAGTTANIFVQLTDIEGIQTDKVRLKCSISHRKKFQRGHVSQILL
ncbi:unnamed protein product [Brugia timori]|uniref:PLAT domain-containing protein n=1 Tax=Brugia timori TaxID=42155 RepID=A0A0R3R2H1_9BILA|nr:unnamed protein product [Brugia timori]